MADRSLRTVPATNYVSSNTNAHYNVPLLEWFSAGGFLYKSYPGTFTPALGTTSPEFASNVSPTKMNNYVSNLGSQFWPQEGQLQNGFRVTKPSQNTMVEFNVAIGGGDGLWMPCPIFASFSFYYENETYANSNFVPRNIGFELTNVKTGEKKKWGAGWSNGHTANPTGNLYVLNGATKVNSIRDMGPDWYITSAIFNFRSNSTADNQSPIGKLVDCRLGYRHDGTQGTNKMILPKILSWSDFQSDRNNNIIQFEGV